MLQPLSPLLTSLCAPPSVCPLRGSLVRVEIRPLVRLRRPSSGHLCRLCVRPSRAWLASPSLSLDLASHRTCLPAHSARFVVLDSGVAAFLEPSHPASFALVRVRRVLLKRLRSTRSRGQREIHRLSGGIRLDPHGQQGCRQRRAQRTGSYAVGVCLVQRPLHPLRPLSPLHAPKRARCSRSLTA